MSAIIYQNIRSAVFLSRPNRFIAEIEIDGQVARCHVKNTGRCRELLIPGTEIYVQESSNPLRKTKYSLITVRKGDRLVNIDSQVPNKVFGAWLGESGYIPNVTKIKAEAQYGNSRFDFYIEAGQRKIFAEVKGVTLEEDGVAMFPDAPTLRGVKHLNELCRCIEDGYEAMCVFIIQMRGVRYFTPNVRTHADFGQALRNAEARGVRLLALDCGVEQDAIAPADFVEIRL